MQTVVSTGWTSSEVKLDIFETFRAMVYARSEEIYEEKLREFEDLASGVEVSPSRGTSSDLLEYFNQNWRGTRWMWSHVDRRALPTGGQNTTCRLERTFGALKMDLRLRNYGKLPITRAVIQVVEWIEGKLVDRMTAAMRKEFRVFYKDAELRSEFVDAARCLNEAGCRALDMALKKLEKSAGRMRLVERGVEEAFKSKEEDKEDTVELYGTTEESCCCTFYHNYQVPCKHMYFLRKEKMLPFFDKNLFSSSLHSDRAFDLQRSEADQAPPNTDSGLMLTGKKSLANWEHAEDLSSSEDDCRTLAAAEKFRLVDDSLAELRSILLFHGSKTIWQYLQEIKVMKANARRGLSLLSKQKLLKDGLKGDDEGEPDTKGEESASVQDEELSAAGEEIKQQIIKKPAKKLVFLDEITSRGAPKKLKSMTGKWKKSGKLEPKTANNLRKRKLAASSERVSKKQKEEVVEISDHEGEEVRPSLRDQKICVAPSRPGQFGETTVTMKDFGSLAPKSHICDTVVNLWLLTVLYQHDVMHASRFAFVMTEFAQALQGWNPNRESDPPDTVLRWTTHLGLWKASDLDLLIFPLVHRSHYYVLVLDCKSICLYILESLGGDWAREPPVVAKFLALMNWHRVQEGLTAITFPVTFPSCPIQYNNSNDCGVHAMVMVEKIYQDPEGFKSKAQRRTLGNWFARQSLKGRRDELADFIKLLAQDQRRPGEVLEGEPAVELPTPTVVQRQVCF